MNQDATLKKSTIPPWLMQVRLTAAGVSDLGRVRSNNEDRILQLPQQGVFCVADGMGGAAGGERASQAVADAITAACASTLSPVDAMGKLKDALLAANATVRTMARHAGVQEMGSTAVALGVDPATGKGELIHAGDSRAYLLRKGKLTLLTEDHSVIAEVRKRLRADGGDAADLSLEQGFLDGKLTRAVGLHEKLELSIQHLQFQAGDQILLCSDGLTRHFKDHELETFLVMRENAPQDSAVRDLIAETNKRGGKDNVSVILVRIAKAFFLLPAIDPERGLFQQFKYQVSSFAVVVLSLMILGGVGYVRHTKAEADISSAIKRLDELLASPLAQTADELDRQKGLVPFLQKLPKDKMKQYADMLHERCREFMKLYQAAAQKAVADRNARELSALPELPDNTGIMLADEDKITYDKLLKFSSQKKQMSNVWYDFENALRKGESGVGDVASLAKKYWKIAENVCPTDSSDPCKKIAAMNLASLEPSAAVERLVNNWPFSGDHFNQIHEQLRALIHKVEISHPLSAQLPVVLPTSPSVPSTPAAPGVPSQIVNVQQAPDSTEKFRKILEHDGLSCVTQSPEFAEALKKRGLADAMRKIMTDWMKCQTEISAVSINQLIKQYQETLDAEQALAAIGVTGNQFKEMQKNAIKARFEKTVAAAFASGDWNTVAPFLNDNVVGAVIAEPGQLETARAWLGLYQQMESGVGFSEMEKQMQGLAIVLGVPKDTLASGSRDAASQCRAIKKNLDTLYAAAQAMQAKLAWNIVADAKALDAYCAWTPKLNAKCTDLLERVRRTQRDTMEAAQACETSLLMDRVECLVKHISELKKATIEYLNGLCMVVDADRSRKANSNIDKQQAILILLSKRTAGLLDDKTALEIKKLFSPVPPSP